MKLANLFDNVNDYVLTSSMLKIKPNHDFIVFDVAG